MWRSSASRALLLNAPEAHGIVAEAVAVAEAEAGAEAVAVAEAEAEAGAAHREW